MNKQILTRALIVAGIVGTILNLINQWHIVNGVSPRWGALLFTYCVPFLVSYFSASMANKDKPTESKDEIFNQQLKLAVLDLESSLDYAEHLPDITRQHIQTIKSLLNNR